MKCKLEDHVIGDSFFKTNTWNQMQNKCDTCEVNVIASSAKVNPDEIPMQSIGYESESKADPG